MHQLTFIQVRKNSFRQRALLRPLWRSFSRELDANRGEHTPGRDIAQDLARRIKIQGSRSDMHFEIAFLQGKAIGFSNYAVDLGTIHGLIDSGGGVFLGFYIFCWKASSSACWRWAHFCWESGASAAPPSGGRCASPC